MKIVILHKMSKTISCPGHNSNEILLVRWLDLACVLGRHMHWPIQGHQAGASLWSKKGPQIVLSCVENEVPTSNIVFSCYYSFPSVEVKRTRREIWPAHLILPTAGRCDGEGYLHLGTLASVFLEKAFDPEFPLALPGYIGKV